MSEIPNSPSPVHLASFYTESPCRTKICCTIGPSSAAPETLATLVNNGMSMFTRQVVTSLRQHLKTIKTATQVAVLLDLNGSKPRIGTIGGEGFVRLQEGNKFVFNLNDSTLIGNANEVYADLPFKQMSVGDMLFVDDGRISFTIVEILKNENKVVCLVDNDGKLSSTKGIILLNPGKKEHYRLGDKDLLDIQLALDLEVDFVTLSCIHSAFEVMEVRKLLGNAKTKILSKIENKDGLDNFEEILKVSDGIIIDRGYLGVQIDLTKLALIQKDIVQRCQLVGKPVWLANQILQSMTKSPIPNRSEASDVTTAVIDGADGLILAEETAIGNYPLESLLWLRKICYEAERHIDYGEVHHAMMKAVPKPIGVTESLACSAVKCGREVNAKCIFVYTESGATGRLLSKYKPAIPVVVTTNNLMTARQLAASFGLISYFHPNNILEEEVALRKATHFAMEIGLVRSGDNVVILSGGMMGLEASNEAIMRIYTIA